MVVEQAAQTRLDEPNRCRDLAWPTTYNQNRGGLTNDIVTMKDEASQIRFEGLIRVGQKVFSTGDQSIGQITKLLPGAEGQVSYLVIHATHFWGRHKILPVELVSDVKTKGIWLSIDRNKFQELPDYKTDASIAAEVENALWNNEILRVTDFHEIDVRVKNGVVFLTGHITGMMNQGRVESAVGNVKGILGMRILLVADDKLLLKVAEALVQIEQVEGNRVFAKIQNGVVVLSGEVISADDRDLAEQYAANVPWVRGVINNIAAPGIDLDAEDQRFLQPSIGEKIFFCDGLFGFVKQVIINRNSRRVDDMIIQGRFPDKQLKSESREAGETLTPERLAVIPVSVIRYLTSYSGFLLIDSTETTRYQDFDPLSFVLPDADWVPPYPYCVDHVRFSAE